MTHRGPFQPLLFCDSMIVCHFSTICIGMPCNKIMERRLKSRLVWVFYRITQHRIWNFYLNFLVMEMVKFHYLTLNKVKLTIALFVLWITKWSCKGSPGSESAPILSPAAMWDGGLCQLKTNSVFGLYLVWKSALEPSNQWLGIVF